MNKKNVSFANHLKIIYYYCVLNVKCTIILTAISCTIRINIKLNLFLKKNIFVGYIFLILINMKKCLVKLNLIFMHLK